MMKGTCYSCKFRTKRGYLQPCKDCTSDDDKYELGETYEQEKARILKEKSLFNKYGEE